MRTIRGFVVLFVAGIVSGAVLGTLLPAGPGLSHGLSLPAGITSCESGQPVPIARLAAPNAPALSTVGVGIEQAGFGDGTLVVYSLDRDSAPSDVLSGSQQPGVGLLYARTSDSTYKSCDYHFADNSRALALAQAVAPMLEANGYLSEAEFNDPANLFFLSDNPLNSTTLVFTVVLHGVGGTEVKDPRGTVSAVMDRQTMSVISAGRGNLYVNCDERDDCLTSN
jgi:hypothetical protein